MPMNRSVRVCGRGAGESLSHRRHSAGTYCVQSSAGAAAGRRCRTDSGTQLFQPPASDSRIRSVSCGIAGQCTPVDAGRHSCEHMFVPDDANILHADLDAFFASVEQRDDPSLRGRPVIVGGGVVLAASYEAKARGVRTAMGGREARLLCPDAVVVPPRMSAYSEASKAVFAVFEHTTPLVEGLSIDEAFLDVGGLARVSGTPEAIAARLRAEVREQVGLAITVGVARTKFLAKV